MSQLDAIDQIIMGDTLASPSSVAAQDELAKALNPEPRIQQTPYGPINLDATPLSRSRLTHSRFLAGERTGDPFDAIRPQQQQTVMDIQLERAGVTAPGIPESIARAGFRIPAEQVEQRSGFLQMLANEAMDEAVDFGLMSDAYRNTAREYNDLLFQNVRQRFHEIANDPKIMKSPGGEGGIMKNYANPTWYAENLPGVTGGLAIDLSVGALTGPYGFAVSASTQVMGNVYPESYESALNSGLTPEQAHDIALLESSVNGITTLVANRLSFNVFSKTPISKSVADGAARVYTTQIAKSFTFGGAAEGLTEGIEELVQVATSLQREVTLGNMTTKEAVDKLFSMETLDRVLTGAALGVLSGGPINAAVDVRSVTDQRSVASAMREAKAYVRDAGPEIQADLQSVVEQIEQTFPEIAEAIKQEEAAAKTEESQVEQPAEGDIALTPEETAGEMQPEQPVVTNSVKMQFEIDKGWQADARAEQYFAAADAEIRTGRIDLKDYRDFMTEAVRDMPDAIRDGVLARANRPTASNLRKVMTYLHKTRTKEARLRASKSLDDLKSAARKMDSPELRKQAETALLRVVKTKKAKQSKAIKQIQEFRKANPGVAIPKELEARASINRIAIAEMDRFAADNFSKRVAAMLDQTVTPQDRSFIKGRIESVATEVNDTIGGKGVLTPRRTIRKLADWDVTRLFRIPFGLPENATPRTLASIIGGGFRSETFRTLYADLDKWQDQGLERVMYARDALKGILLANGLTPQSPELWAMTEQAARNVSRAEAMVTGKDIGTTATLYTYKAQVGRVYETVEQREAAIPGDTPKESVEIKMTSAERMYLIASLRDPETYQKMVIEGQAVRLGSGVDTFVVTPDLISKIERDMPLVERRIINGVVSTMNSVANPWLREWSIRELGFDVTRPGTYFPRHRITSVKDEATTMTDIYAKAQVGNADILGERDVNAVGAIEIRDIFVEYNRYMWVSAMLTSMGPAIRNAEVVLGSDEVSDAFRTSDISRAHRFMGDRLRALTEQAIGSSGTLTETGHFINNLLGNSVIAALGNNPVIMSYQYLSAGSAGIHMGRRYIAQAIAERAFMDKTLDAKLEKVPAIWWRMQNNQTGLLSEGGFGQLTIPGIVESQALRERAVRLSMIGVHITDQHNLRTIYRAAELKAEAEGGEAGDIAAETVKVTQAMWDVLHTTGLAADARKNPILKILTVFRSEVSKRNDMRLLLGEQHRRSEISDAAYYVQVAELFGTEIVGMILISSMFRWLTGGPDEPDEEAKTILRKFTSSVLGIVPGGSYADYLVNKAMGSPWGPSWHPLLSLLEDTGKSFSQVIAGAYDADPIKFADGMKDLAVNVTGVTTGIALVSPNRTLEAFFDRIFGEDDTPAAKAPRVE